MDLFNRPNYGTEYRLGTRAALGERPKALEPAVDNRYPAYAAQMQDGRLVTDYRNHCSRNIPAGAQYTTKKWMVDHAEEIMDVSRKRQAEWSGASLRMANTVPPPADVVHSTPFESEVMPTGAIGGVGLVRADTPAPALFGTFMVEPTVAETRLNKKNISVTTKYEGGRNSLRG